MSVESIKSINEDSIIFIYKEQTFNGFAPCFDNNIFSLACCKGNKKFRGMRDIASEFVMEKKDVWILSIAGTNIENDNASQTEYEPGDFIYLAKITDVKSWEEYSKSYKPRRLKEKEDKFRRLDSIYDFIAGVVHIRDNEFHKTPANRDTDCGTGKKDYWKRKQILLSNDYYIFKKGVKLNHYSVKRGYRYKDVSAIPIRDYIFNNKSCIEIQHKPEFIINNEKCTGNCKKCMT